MSWQFFLGRASDMAILAPISDATDKNLSPVFNQKGSFSCTIKIDCAAALIVEKWKHCIMVQKPDGTMLAWSGPIVSIVDSANQGTTTLTAQGWQSELDYRWIRTVTELQEAVAYVTPIPAPDNPSFASNTSSWSVSGGGSIVRNTSTYDSSPASGLWTPAANSTIETTFTGRFMAGVAYVLTFKTFGASSGFPFRLLVSHFGSESDYASPDFAVSYNNWLTNTITWIPKADETSVKLRLYAGASGPTFHIDSLSVEDSIHTDAPVFTNPSFVTNTSGWTATTSTITRDTTVMDSGSAAGRWDNTGASDNLGSGDVLEATLTGKFYRGVTYSVVFRIKSSSSTGTTLPVLLSFGASGDVVTSWIGFNDTKFTTVTINWTPTATVTGATFGMLISVTSPFFYLTVDTCRIERWGGSAVFTEINDGDIAEALVRLANRQTDSNGNTRSTHLTPNGTSTTPRTRTYQIGQNIGAAIRELSDIENGFDIVVDPLTREIDFVPNTSYTDQTDIAYGYNMLPRNLDDVVVNDDGTGKANSINVQGAYIIGNADSPSDIADVGIILEDWVSASDIKDEQIIGAYANEEVVFRADGQMTIAAKPSPGAPMPYIDYEWGDKVYISANKGRMQLDRQAARVFSGRISWNAQNEAILDELGLTP